MDPAHPGKGAEVKDLLRRNDGDRGLAEDIASLRHVLEIEISTSLLLDTTFVVDADRSAASLDRVIDQLVAVRLAHHERRAARQNFVEEVREVIPTVDYDVSVAASHADLIIAATAIATRAVVSADKSAYEEIALQV